MMATNMNKVTKKETLDISQWSNSKYSLKKITDNESHEINWVLHNMKIKYTNISYYHDCV